MSIIWELSRWLEPINWAPFSLAGFLMVVVTGILAYGSFRLLKSNRELVRVSQETAKQQLRAYVGLGTKGLYSTDQRPKMQITNFGDTPARRVTIWRDIVDAPPDGFPYSGGQFLAKNIMIQPKQSIPFFWGDSMEERAGKFLYGYVEYSDIHGRHWRCRFAYQHKHDTWYTHHNEHNDEIAIKPA